MHAIAQDATRIRHKSGQRPLQRGSDQRGIARAITAELMALCGGPRLMQRLRVRWFWVCVLLCLAQVSGGATSCGLRCTLCKMND